jgi:hypothetical protein
LQYTYTCVQVKYTYTCLQVKYIYESIKVLLIVYIQSDMLSADQRRQIIYIATGIIFVFIGFTYYYFWVSDASIADTTKFSHFCTTLSLLGIILGFTVLALDYCKVAEDKNTELQNIKVKECQTNWIELEKLFIANYPYLDRLYGQIYPSHPDMKDITLKLSPDEWRKVRILEVHVCSILFQSIENICIYAEPTQMVELIKVWRSWFQSQIVRRQWSVMREFCTPSTQLWIDQHVMPPTPLIPNRKQLSKKNTEPSLSTQIAKVIKKKTKNAINKFNKVVGGHNQL